MSFPESPAIHCWCQGGWKHPKVIFLRVDRGVMSCSEVSRCEVSTKAWQLLVSIAGSDQKRVRIRRIWWMIHDDSCSVDQGCLKFGLLERRRLCCMFVSTRYMWGFVDLENWITILSMRFRYGFSWSTCRDWWKASLASGLKQLQAVGVSNRFLGAQQSQMPLRLVWSLLLLLLKKCWP